MVSETSRPSSQETARDSARRGLSRRQRRIEEQHASGTQEEGFAPLTVCVLVAARHPGPSRIAGREVRLPMAQEDVGGSCDPAIMPFFAVLFGITLVSGDKVFSSNGRAGGCGCEAQDGRQRWTVLILQRLMHTITELLVRFDGPHAFD